MRRIESLNEMSPFLPMPDPRLTIPPDAVQMLPDRNASVPHLLSLRLPNPLRTTYRPTVSPWSNTPPSTVQPSVLKDHLIPPTGVVGRLLSATGHLSPQIRSIQRVAISPDNALPEHLPIWILNFWRQIHEAHQGRQQWKICRDWVTSRPRAGVGLLDQLDRTLINIWWQGYLNGRRRDRSVNDIFDLLSNGELNSGQVNDLLELIERGLTVRSDGLASLHLVAPTELAVLVVDSYHRHADLDYRKQRIQISVEDDLVSGWKSSVSSAAWISVSRCGHWVPYVVDPVSSSITYGDSLGGSIPVTLREALRWWLLEHRKEMNLSTDKPVVVRSLPITRQDDNFSCGILATNAIGHHLLHDALPLVRRDPTSIKAYRIKSTIEILKLDAEFVGYMRKIIECRLTIL